MRSYALKIFPLTIVISLMFACSNFPKLTTESPIPFTVIQLSDLDQDSYTKIGLGLVNAVKYSPDNKILAVATTTNLLLYETSSYTLINRFPDDFIDNTEWSPDSNKIAFMSSYDIHILDISNGSDVLCEINGVWLVGEEMAWSPDGKMLASIDSTDNQGAVYIWDAETGSLIQKIVYPEKRVSGRYIDANGVSWSPDGSRLAIAYDFANILAPEKPAEMIVWKFAKNESIVLNRWNIPNEYYLMVMEGLEWTPDQLYLVLGGAFITVFDADDGTLINSLEAPSSEQFAISIDGKFITIASGEANVSLVSYSIPTLEKIKEYHGRIKSPESISISPDGKSIVAGDSFFDSIDVWDQQSGSLFKTIQLDSHWNDDVKFSPDNQWLSALGRDNNMRIYNAENLMLIKTITGIGVSSLQTEAYWSKDSQSIVWAGVDKNGDQVWQSWNMDLDDKSVITNGSSDFIIGIAEGRKRISTGKAELIQVWSTDLNGDYQLTAEIRRDPKYTILDSNWSPDYNYLAVRFTDLVGEKARLVIFDYKLQVKKIIEKRNIVDYNVPTWSPDGKWLATIDTTLCGNIICTGYDSILTIRSADTMAVHLTYKIDHSNNLIVWSPDSKFLATTGSPKGWGLTIFAIDVTSQPLQIIEETGSIESMDWSSDGKLITFTGANGLIYEINAENLLDTYFLPNQDRDK